MDLDRVQTIAQVNGRAGMDLQLSKHAILGILLSDMTVTCPRQEDIHMDKYKNGNLDTIMKLDNKEVNHWA